jgi:hypothetical protein
MSEERLANRSRRDVLRKLTLSGAGGLVALTVCGHGQPAFGQSIEGDLAILTAALYLENEAIAAYQAGAESKLLPDSLLKVAVAFQSDHKYHRDGIIGAVKLLGGTPIADAGSYHFGRLSSANGILRLACQLERSAVNAYATLASNIQNRTVLNYAAHVLADEARHVAILNGALGRRNY